MPSVDDTRNTLNSAIPKQKGDVFPRHRSPEAMVMHIKTNGIEAT